MQGLHLTADLHDCAPGRPEWTDAGALRTLCLAVVDAAGLTAVGELFHRFPAAGGVTGVVLLAESHVAVHTWPELRAVTLDVYVCNLGADNSRKADRMLDALCRAFAPARTELNRLPRGAAAGARPPCVPSRR